MAGDGILIQVRKLPPQPADQALQCRVLRIGELLCVATFEFDPDGEIVATGPPPPTGCAGMPGPGCKRNKLNRGPVARDHHMSRNPEVGERLEIRMSTRIQDIQEQVLDEGAAELAGREADRVDHDQLRPHALRPRIEIRTRDPSGLGPPIGRQRPGCPVRRYMHSIRFFAIGRSLDGFSAFLNILAHAFHRTATAECGKAQSHHPEQNCERKKIPVHHLLQSGSSRLRFQNCCMAAIGNGARPADSGRPRPSDSSEVQGRKSLGV